MGDTIADDAQYIEQTLDGGYIVAGNIESTDGDINGYHGGSGDIWILKLDNSGNVEWKRAYGSSGYELIHGIKQTSDKGFVFISDIDTKDGDVSVSLKGKGDIWFVKIDSVGKIKWQKCLGGSDTDSPKDLRLTNDGGYIIAGYTYSNDGDVTGNHGGGDCWIVKLDSTGKIQWQKTIGGTSQEFAYSIDTTFDGGYIVAASFYGGAMDGDVNCNPKGFLDYWILKLDSTGSIVWQTCLGGNDYDVPSSIQQTIDRGYIICGNTKSDNGNVTGYHDDGHGYTDWWVIKLDSTGILQWQKCIGGTNIDQAFSTRQTTDSCYIIAGSTLSNDGDILGMNHSITSNAFIVKLSTKGDIQWKQVLGGSSFNGDGAASVIQTKDGGYIMAGENASTDGDASKNNGFYDFWVVKLSASTAIGSIAIDNSCSVYPNPVTDEFIFQNNNIYSGSMQLSDILGRVYYSSSYQPVQKLLISTSSLPNGIYILKIIENGKCFFKKLIKE